MNKDLEKQGIAISGASGLVGCALRQRLQARCSNVQRLSRGAANGPDEIPWNPGQPIAQEHWQGVDALIHLAGESIASGRWTKARRERLWRSRVQATRALCEGLTVASTRPQTLLCASAVGWYGDRGEERLTEKAGPGSGFLAELAQAWEEACTPAVQAGMRVVHLRFGMILDSRGGALGKMLTPFRLGLGGPVGAGNQYWSWVALQDVVGAIEHALDSEVLHGPINVVAPQPQTSRQFAKALGRSLSRPAVIPLPAFAARLILGRSMANELLLASTNVIPQTLLESGFVFQYPELDDCLKSLF